MSPDSLERFAQWWGWAGSAREFVDLDDADFLAALEAHHLRLLNQGVSGSQREAWATEYSVIRDVLQAATRSLENWSLVFEYELPLEGGRRPDVVVLTGETVIVLEFKGGLFHPTRAAVDQVNAYARNLAEYHEETHEAGLGRMERSVIPILVLPSATDVFIDTDEALVVSANNLGPLLEQLASPGQIDLGRWLHSAYAPLPSLVRAAKAIFDHEHLPHVRAAKSALVPETVDLVVNLADEARIRGKRHLILVSGVPGAGKTLVGLRAVYEHSDDQQVATFLSGNGPLVKVLQDALKSSVFVKDLHAYIRNYGINDRQPTEHVVVFDEAQRAWDRAFMQAKRNVAASEPELLIRAAQRLPGWSAFVGLVGDGQEIHSGEEGGLTQWAEAIANGGSTDDWVVHLPGHLAGDFSGLNVQIHDLLELKVSLRSRQAEQLHQWVAALLRGDIAAARVVADEIDPEKFVMYQSRDLAELGDYCRDRYSDDPDMRYGIVSSSHAKSLVHFGVDNSFMVTSRMNLARWYNTPPDHEDSCCQLRKPVTEFGCQGLELDMPIVAWGSDMIWSGSGWRMTPVRRRHALEDPELILENVYRVLLTRGRDGFCIFVPPAPMMDQTSAALEDAGVRPLVKAEQAVGASAPPS